MTVSDTSVSPERIAAVRHFNRFFTRQIGVLREGLLHSPYPLTDARVLYELGARDGLTASQLCRELGLDSGHASRILARFEEQGMLQRERCGRDGRQLRLSLTPTGRDAFALIDQRSAVEVAELLGRLTEDQQQRLLAAMRTIETTLDTGLAYAEPFIIRGHQPGDMGWVVHRHGALYWQEYRWDERFEALVARIVADFVDNYDPARERCWIAEVAGEIVGSVFCVRAGHGGDGGDAGDARGDAGDAGDAGGDAETGDGQVAKLRLLLVEPKVRGMGLGTRLVQECIRFAKRAGYAKLVLWTNSCLDGARHIYVKTGFSLVGSEPHHSFGHDLVGENWELRLR
jgi:DNA-binding MarR family transcriptional regulator/GNAT superfamily N-acetyltransferase